MTREEAKHRLLNVERCTSIHTREDVRDFEALEMAIKALEQEPCEVSQGLVKDSQEFSQEPCEDAVSRQAVFDLMRSLTRWCVRSEDGKSNNVGLLYDDVMFGIDKLPPVNPQSKTGHWIYKQYGGYPEQGNYHCSECDAIDNRIPTYCPSCGARMIEPQESEDNK